MRTSEQPPRNIYKNARKYAGLTQERWAEAVGVSVDSIRVYENGSVIPTDETVRAMSEISGLAMAIAGKVVGRELNGADQSKLIDSFIDELGE